MIQKNYKKIKKNTKIVFLLMMVLTFSCVENENLPMNQNQELISASEERSLEYERKLAELTLVFGEVLKDKSAMKELFSFSEIEGNSGSIKYNLKTLFQESKSPNSRRSSAIVERFKSLNSQNARLSQSVSVDELISFIEEHNISVTAPYLAEDFELETINEITLSWWTQEFEDLNFQKNADWTGETKAVKINLNEVADLSIERILGGDYFLVDDDWAEKNPTIVLGNFKIQAEKSNAKVQVGSNFRSLGAPVELCNSNYETNQHLIAKMPAFRLDDNYAPWPKDNFMYCWVAFSESITVGSNGTPSIAPDVNYVLQDKEITRKEARIKRWKSTNSPFIISNWKPEADDMYVIWGYEKSNSTLEVTSSVKATKDGISTEYGFKMVSQTGVQLASALSFDKCYTIRNNVNGIDVGFGYYGDTSLPKYGMGKIRMYFTLETL
ncbi:hypothetical protein PBT90_00995 [Algoriphagus halophytocola]|uniref:DUF4848 domain-containing protein n=1 Tax=Algoriphagus halophytocola TaxID=2991499 RepID=A0ABY6MGD6_9BACT|nr:MULTISPECIES: hypothetical protein [unclassified Algoriphagus]UZD22034.1 hypothetical protein OM944_15320 [Algoriphagus sp. TR-M5]WBL43285.1 hypothetical protein PBT90_00995 [Algoriphagus sp. TR-M9]